MTVTSRENKGWEAIKKAIFGEGRPATEKEKEDFGLGQSAQRQKSLAKTKNEYYAETDEEKEASKAAVNDWVQREQDAFKSYKPKGPAYRIRQIPSGEYVIERRFLSRPHRPDRWGFGAPGYALAHLIAKEPVQPTERYDAVVNPGSPIVTKKSEYSYRSYHDVERLTGYSPLVFNIFSEAEAYLRRMAATPEECSVGYDFPPLKRRVEPKAKSRRAPRAK